MSPIGSCIWTLVLQVGAALFMKAIEPLGGISLEVEFDSLLPAAPLAFQSVSCVQKKYDQQDSSSGHLTYQPDLMSCVQKWTLFLRNCKAKISPFLLYVPFGHCVISQQQKNNEYRGILDIRLRRKQSMELNCIIDINSFVHVIAGWTCFSKPKLLQFTHFQL